MKFIRRRKSLFALTAAAALTGFGVVAGVLTTPLAVHALEESKYSEWMTVANTDNALEYRWGTDQRGGVAVIQFRGPAYKTYRLLLHRSESGVPKDDGHKVINLSGTGKGDTTSWYDTVNSIELDNS